jgi:8-oxo-dGTP pyrophosphatase MutT (NUDIX family)
MKRNQGKLIMTRGCSNCGDLAHSFRQCLAPITSHGIIAIRVLGNWKPAEILAEHESSITGLELSGNIQFLLIQRRDSLGFVELMRGKYTTIDFIYITTQMKGMTVRERERFLTLSFQQLWDDLWGSDHSVAQYRQEKEISRQKFETLREQGLIDVTGVKRTLRELFDMLGPGWQTPEWGFPKGRRDPFETERDCALREMFEETGLHEKDIQIIENMEPIQETFFGTNHIHYCHKYRIVYVKESVKVTFDPTNEHMRREIGDLGWFTLDEAMSRIRPENVEKREVLLRTASILLNFCPFSFS